MRPQLVILAGGASSRMGRDKLRLRDPAGGLLIGRWFDGLNWPAPPLLVLPPDGTPPEELDWPVAHDTAAGEGPLRGVATALDGATTDWLLVVAVDTPGIGRAQLDFLIARRETDTAARLWMLRRPDGIEPFPLLIHRDLATAVRTRLANGRRSLHGLADEPAARVVDAPAVWPARVWQNLNRPADLDDYLQAFGT